MCESGIANQIDANESVSGVREVALIGHVIRRAGLDGSNGVQFPVAFEEAQNPSHWLCRVILAERQCIMNAANKRMREIESGDTSIQGKIINILDFASLHAVVA